MGQGKAMAPAQTRARAAPRLCTKPIFFIHSINIGGDIALGAVVAAEIFCFVPSLSLSSSVSESVEAIRARRQGPFEAGCVSSGLPLKSRAADVTRHCQCCTPRHFETYFSFMSSLVKINKRTSRNFPITTWA